MRSHRLIATAALSLLFAATTAFAAPLDVSLTFGSLPSAQGWTYSAVGSHAGTIESTVFTANGTTLRQNTMGLGHGVAGGGILYVLTGGITTTDTKSLRMEAQVTAVEGSGIGAQGQGGFCAGFTTGSQQYAFAVTNTRLYLLGAGGFVQVGGTFDNTAFHQYDYDFTPPSTTRLYRDGVLIGTSTASGAVSANRVFFGDGTGGANADAEIRSFRFIQDVATSATATSWGRIKSLYR